MASGTINTFSRMFSGYISYTKTNDQDTRPGFAVTVTPKVVGQMTLIGRNSSTGAIYIVYFDGSVSRFLIAHTITGSAPTIGEKIYVSYEIA